MGTPLHKAVSAALVASSFALVACGGGGNGKDLLGKGSQASTVSPDPTYPAGPYGYEVNSTIADFMLYGRHNTSVTGSLLDQPMADLWLSSYRKQYKVIVVAAAAEWCVPCNEEAPQLEQLFQSYNTNGPQVAFLEALVQSKDGSPADENTITRWVNKHGITFDMAIDPTGVLQPYYNIDAFPMGMVIRTSDMQIFFEANGVDPMGLKAAVDPLLTGN